jgi:hypothetical protein
LVHLTMLADCPRGAKPGPESVVIPFY